MKFPKFRSLIQGRPVFVIKNGVLQQKALQRLRFTVDDLLDALRQKDVFSIDEVLNAIVETNGTLSVQVKSDYTPLSPKTVGKDVPEKTAPVPIIMDGQTVNQYFADNNVSDNTIEVIAATLGVKKKDIMLLTFDENGKTTLIKKDEDI